MSILDRNILPQDQPQQDERSGPDRKKRADEAEAKYNAEVESVNKQNIEIDRENILIEKTSAENEAKYQADVIAYNKELTRVEDGRKEINVLYDKRIEGYQQSLSESLQLAAANEPEINRRMGTYSPAYYDQVNRTASQTNTTITFANEQRQSALNQYEFKMAYPSVSLDQQTSQAFKSAGPKDSLIGIYEKYQGSYDAQAVRSRQNALLNAGVIHSGIKQNREQSKKPYIAPVIPSKSPLYTPEMQKRIDAIKPAEIPRGTVFPHKPTLAQKQQGTLTNVNTGQYIDQWNKPQTNVVANPRGIISGLKRIEAPIGTPIREKPSDIITTGLIQTGKIRVSNTNEWDGQQSRKVRVSDPKIDAMIGAHGYEKTNEIIGNYNRINESNNLILTKQYLDYGKSIGAKQVKVKQDQGSRTFSINALDELVKSEGSFSFVRTPEMKKEKLLQIQQTRDFLNVSEKEGFEKFEIRTPGKKTEIVFLEDKKLAAERIRAAEEGSSFKLVRTEKMKLEQKEYFENRRSLTAATFPIIIKTPEGKEILVDTTNKKEAQKQIKAAPIGSRFELGGQTPENKAIQSSFKYLDDLSLEMYTKYTNDDVAKMVQVGAEGGKGLLSFVASGQEIGEQTIRPFLTGKPPTNPPISLSSETTSSQLFPVGENWRIKSGGELLVSAKQQYSKYGTATFIGDVLPTFGIGAGSIIRGGVGLVKASPLLVIAGGKQLVWQSYKVGLRVSPHIPVKIKNTASKFGSKISDSIPSGKLKNFAQKYPIISPRTYFDLRVVKQYTKQNYPDYKNIEIIKEKGQKRYTVSGGLEEKRPNIPDTPVVPQLKARTKSMGESILTDVSKKQVISRPDKQGDLLFSIDFKKEFKINNGKLNPVEKTGTLIARPRLPKMAKTKKVRALGKKEDNPILSNLRKSYQKQKKSLLNLPGEIVTGIRTSPKGIYSYLKDSANKSFRQPTKTKQTRIIKLDWLTEYTQPEKKMQYAKTSRVIITSADPDFEKSALTLGMKRYGSSSFVKENPSLRFMTNMEKAKKSGLLTETVQSREGPLKLFRMEKEKKFKQGEILVNVPKRGDISESRFTLERLGRIKIQPKSETRKLTQFDFVGENTILGRFYETKGGLGKAEFVKDVTKTKNIITFGSKDFERKLGGVDLYKNIEGTEPRIKPERKLIFRSPYPTDIWDSEKAVAGGSGRGISMETQNTILNRNPSVTPAKLDIPIKTDYLKTVSSYTPRSQTSGSGNGFDIEEETIRYPDFGKANRFELKIIPKISNMSLTYTITKISTVQKTKTVQKQSELLKTVQSTVQVTKQKTQQKTKQIQKLKTPMAEKFAFRPKLLTGIVTITKLTPVLSQTPIQGLKQPQKLKTIQKLEFVLPKIPRFRRTTTKPPRIIGGLIILKEEKKKEIKRTYQPGEKADFLGNVSETNIVGIYNRSETTYGQRKINKLLAGDRRVVKGQSRTVGRRRIEKKDVFGFKKTKTKKPKFF